MRGAETLAEVAVERICVVIQREPIERDIDLKILPFVARLDAADGAAVGLGHAVAVENVGARTRQRRKGFGNLGPAFRARRRNPGSHKVKAQIGVQDAARAQRPGLGRNDDARHAELARDIAGMKRPRTAIGEQRKSPEIMAALG